MNDQTRKNALLPSGFEDLLPPEAESQARAISVLMEEFSAFGYMRVKPPMAEFEESMLGDGPGAALAQSTFRVMDPVTHRMMALRSDITAQIARISRSRLLDEPRPLRLMYANDVIRTKASQQRTLRQFTQVGCEMIGLDSAQSDVEMALVALSGLLALNVKAVTLDFTLPRLVNMLIEDCGLEAEDECILKGALAGREADQVLRIKDKKAAEIFSGLLNVSGPAEPALKNLKSIKLPKSAKAMVARLEDVYTHLQQAMMEMGLEEGVTLTIDLLETKGFDYHDGVAFTLFAQGARGEIGRGGRYTVFSGAEDATSASGFTLYMDSLRQVMPDFLLERVVFVPDEDGWTLVKNLQNEGWAVVRGLGAKQAPEICTHFYKNGKIEEIS